MLRITRNRGKVLNTFFLWKFKVLTSENVCNSKRIKAIGASSSDLQRENRTAGERGLITSSCTNGHWHGNWHAESVTFNITADDALHIIDSTGVGATRLPTATKFPRLYLYQVFIFFFFFFPFLRQIPFGLQSLDYLLAQRHFSHILPWYRSLSIF